MIKRRIKVLTIFGTRPEAVKLASVIGKLKEQPKIFISKVCVTAQHRKMLDQVLDLFKIKPDYDLNIMRPDQSLFEVTSAVILGLKKVLEREKPDIVLVQGDTTTVFVAGLAAFYFKIPVGHVEAGLRTNDKFQPFPEEINRRLTSHIADFHFAPTKRAKRNLIKEGISKDKIFITGNTVIDTLLMVVKKQSNPTAQIKLKKYFQINHGIPIDNQKIILVTGHRRESFGEGFENICNALKKIALRHKDIILVYPVHLNPNVQKPVYGILGKIPNIYLIDPLDYNPFIFLMSKSYIILTDSGGIQEEAPSLGKPVLVMRNVTERPEAIEAGTSKLVGTDIDEIINETEMLLKDENYYNRISRSHNPYGDGKAAASIVNIIKNKIGE